MGIQFQTLTRHDEQEIKILRIGFHIHGECKIKAQASSSDAFVADIEPDDTVVRVQISFKKCDCKARRLGQTAILQEQIMEHRVGEHSSKQVPPAKLSSSP